MLLSTSSSDIPVPAGRYWVLWLLAALVFLALAVISEIFWRSQGHMPSVNDTRIYWCMHRQKVYSRNGKKTIVITGFSREQKDINPDVLEQVLPGYTVVHLALAGAPAYEIVRDLCEDPRFDGIILFGVYLPLLHPAPKDSLRTDGEYVRYFHNDFHTAALLDERINTALRSSIQSKIVLASASLSLRRILIGKGKPGILACTMNARRYSTGRYYSCLPADVLAGLHERKRVDLFPWRKHSSQQELKHFSRTVLPQWAGALQSRGGDILLIRVPSSGIQWKMEHADMPKSLYWDSLCVLSGVTGIHFQDYQQLGKFTCADDSHLDVSDAREFTRNLGFILREKLETQ